MKMRLKKPFLALSDLLVVTFEGLKGSGFPVPGLKVARSQGGNCGGGVLVVVV